MYSLLALLGIALVFSSLEYLTRRSRPALILAAFFSLLMLLTHNVAAWFVIGVNVAFLSLCDDRKLLLRWLAAQSIAALCYLPWGTVRAHPLQKSGHILYTFSFPVILPVCRSIRPRIVL